MLSMTQKSTPLIFILSLLLLGACGVSRIQAPVAYAPPSKVTRIALVATYMSPIEQPKMPVADASTFNKKTDALAQDLESMMQEKINAYHQSLVQGMEQSLRQTVATGEELNTGARYERAVKKADNEALRIPGPGTFHRVFMGEGSFNPFPFQQGQVADFIKNSPRLRSVARSLSRDLESEIIAISHHQMIIDKPLRFGAEADARLQMELFLYDDRGELIGQAYGETERVRITGEELSEYRAVFDAYPSLQNEVLAALAASKLGEVEE